MIIFDFQNNVADSIEDIVPELVNGRNNGVVIASPNATVSYQPPAIILRFHYSDMTPAPERVIEDTIQKDLNKDVDATGVGQKTEWHPYDLPFSVEFRQESVKRMHEWWERLFSEWGKHFRLNGAPIDHIGFGEPQSEQLSTINLNYRTWVNLKGRSRQKYLVEEFEGKIVHDNDIELVQITSDEIQS